MFRRHILTKGNCNRSWLRRSIQQAIVGAVVVTMLDSFLNAIFRFKPLPLGQRFAEPISFVGFNADEFDEQKRDCLSIEDDAITRATLPEQFGDSRLIAHRSAADFVEKFSLFGDGWGMYATPSLSKFYHAIGCDQGWKGYFVREFAKGNLGLYSGRNTATGFLDKSYGDVPIVVTGCATCHFGRAAGMDVPGLGNKNIDPYALGQWIATADKSVSWMPIAATSHSSLELQTRSLEMAKRLCNEDNGNATQGLVPVSLVIQWFYRQQGVDWPSTMTPGAVKVPALWGYSGKFQSGIFCDGMGDGHNAAWAGMVELAAGNNVDNIRENVEKIIEAEHVLGLLLPPAYPNSIDWKRASRGKLLFTEHCQVCHGRYAKDANGFPVFETPVHTNLDVVNTDDDRLNIVTKQSIELIGQSPLKDVIRISPNYRRGYFAPRLDGIWSRFPYLHNGSVPNIWALLSKPENRPRFFNLADAGESHRFDPDDLGLRILPPGSVSSLQLQLKARAKSREVYDTSRLGQSNQGHDFGSALSNEEKRMLIEYLKTL
ncbi:MAG: hypothetical protein SGI77_01535 [Pirellulaceae bacterium]|nr:hypothetical protein [Pirellulaceae bacterium]